MMHDANRTVAFDEPDVLRRMRERSESHTDQVDRKLRPPAIVVHVWPICVERGEGERLPRRRVDYVLPAGSSVTVVADTAIIERPDGTTLRLDRVSRVEVATSV